MVIENYTAPNTCSSLPPNDHKSYQADPSHHESNSQDASTRFITHGDLAGRSGLPRFISQARSRVASAIPPCGRGHWTFVFGGDEADRQDVRDADLLLHTRPPVPLGRVPSHSAGIVTVARAGCAGRHG